MARLTALAAAADSDARPSLLVSALQVLLWVASAVCVGWYIVLPAVEGYFVAGGIALPGQPRAGALRQEPLALNRSEELPVKISVQSSGRSRFCHSALREASPRTTERLCSHKSITRGKLSYDPKQTVCALQYRWIYVVGDSSMRMFVGALISKLNGTLSDPRFGSFIKHDKGGCEGNKEKTGDKGLGCLREYFDLRNGIRVTFSFKTHATQQTAALEELISPSQEPDIFLLATGPWDLVEYEHPEIKHDDPLALVPHAVETALTWVRSMQKRYTRSTLIVATVNCCWFWFWKMAFAFNDALRAGVSWDNRTLLLDRQPSTDAKGVEARGGIVDKNGSFTCEGWHAYAHYVLEHVDIMLRTVDCKLGNADADAS